MMRQNANISIDVTTTIAFGLVMILGMQKSMLRIPHMQESMLGILDMQELMPENLDM